MYDVNHSEVKFPEFKKKKKKKKKEKEMNCLSHSYLIKC